MRRRRRDRTARARADTAACTQGGGIRSFTDEELHDLAELAAIAMRELDLRLASRRALFNG